MDATGKQARLFSHQAVEEAIRAIADTNLKPQAESMLRTFLAFSALRTEKPDAEIDGAAIRDVVRELFVVLPTPEGVPDERAKGTIRLRGQDGSPRWMNNDSYRGAFEDYVGPNSPGRKMFTDEAWRKPLSDNAIDQVIASRGERNTWPARDALAAVVLRNEPLDEDLEWDKICTLARERFGLSSSDWEQITSDPVLKARPFAGAPWDPAKLSSHLRPPGSEHVKKAEQVIEKQPPHLAEAIERVRASLDRYGQSAIVALAGVPGTSKSHVARLAGRAYASEGCLREIQFSPGYSYEEFMEGPRFVSGLEAEVTPGAFLELNDQALEEPDKQFVLLIEEFSRADLPRVLGELLTFIEYRGAGDSFTTLYGRDATTRVAPNIAFLATFNPSDRSAVTIDAAILRRLRVLDFPPDVDFLREILAANGLESEIFETLAKMFRACEEQAGVERFGEIMPFGHAMFTAVESEGDLYDLWHSELKRILIRPHTPPHELYDTICAHYPWREDPAASVVRPSVTTLPSEAAS